MEMLSNNSMKNEDPASCPIVQVQMLSTKPDILEENVSRRSSTTISSQNENRLAKIISALVYAASSTLVTIVNKLVLTSYGFPSSIVLALGQVTATVIALYLARKLGLISYPNFARDSFSKIFPLPFLYAANVVTGLAGTKGLSLPMLTALRRFAILMTMVLEYYILGIKSGLAVQLSVFTMIAGAIIAALDDMTFNVNGYEVVMLNNVLTATSGVVTKKKLDSKEYGKYGLIFYNAVYMVVPLGLYAYVTGELIQAIQFPAWWNGFFIFYFFLSCTMGFILNVAIVQCTMYNSALTTSVIGCLKNISITYLGMVVGGDYVFSLNNCIGLNIGVVGSLFYTYITFKQK